MSTEKHLTKQQAPTEKTMLTFKVQALKVNEKDIGFRYYGTPRQVQVAVAKGNTAATRTALIEAIKAKDPETQELEDIQLYKADNTIADTATAGEMREMFESKIEAYLKDKTNGAGGTTVPVADDKLALLGFFTDAKAKHPVTDDAYLKSRTIYVGVANAKVTVVAAQLKAKVKALVSTTNQAKFRLFKKDDGTDLVLTDVKAGRVIFIGVDAS